MTKKGDKNMVIKYSEDDHPIITKQFSIKMEVLELDSDSPKEEIHKAFDKMDAGRVQWWLGRIIPFDIKMRVKELLPESPGTEPGKEIQ